MGWECGTLGTLSLTAPLHVTVDAAVPETVLIGAPTLVRTREHAAVPRGVCTGPSVPEGSDAAHPKRRLMKKRNPTLHPFADRPALPVLPARSRCLVRPNC